MYQYNNIVKIVFYQLKYVSDTFEKLPVKSRSVEKNYKSRVISPHRNTSETITFKILWKHVRVRNMHS